VEAVEFYRVTNFTDIFTGPPKPMETMVKNGFDSRTMLGGECGTAQQDPSMEAEIAPKLEGTFDTKVPSNLRRVMVFPGEPPNPTKLSGPYKN
jgi:hypothetical protein